MRKRSVHLDIKEGWIRTHGYEFRVCEIPFVVHQTIPEQLRGEGWSVTEPTTGTSILNYSAQTRKQAVEQATLKVEKNGKENTEAAIDRAEKRMRARNAAKAMSES